MPNNVHHVGPLELLPLYSSPNGAVLPKNGRTCRCAATGGYGLEGCREAARFKPPKPLLARHEGVQNHSLVLFQPESLSSGEFKLPNGQLLLQDATSLLSGSHPPFSTCSPGGPWTEARRVTVYDVYMNDMKI